jgi:cytochrome b
MNQANKIPSESELEEQPKTLKVWDLPVRIFHWSLVILFIAAYITNSLGAEYFSYHLWTGYTVIVLVCFRILWGLVGPYHARFINFVRNPIATTQYVVSFIRKSDKHYAGHNPLGALMVVALLLGILAQAITGLFTNDEIFNLGPLYTYVNDELSLQLTSLHRQIFYWILGAIFLHIIAVVFHVWFKRDNIVKAMFTGKKNAEGLEREPAIKSSRIWLAIIIVIAVALVLAWVISSAPVPVTSTEY